MPPGPGLNVTEAYTLYGPAGKILRFKEDSMSIQSLVCKLFADRGIILLID